MLCNVCRDGLEGIWDASRSKRVCRVKEFFGRPVPLSGDGAIESDKPQNFMFGHHLTKESFIRSIEDGCVMCNRFGRTVKDEPDGVETPNPKLAELGYYSLFNVALRTERPIMFVYVNDTQGGFDMVAHQDDDPDLSFEISPYTGDQPTWDVIQGWITTCTQEHQTCNQKPADCFLPDRLLRVSNNGTEQTYQVVEGSQLAASTRYATLSHCWGTNPIDERSELTSSTVDVFSQPQLVSSLPRTFQDACTVVSRLGLQYLWVDRFCILQDSTSDWRAQSCLMSDIYGSAELNISATGASDDSAGLFHQRDPANVTATVVDLRIDGADQPIKYKFKLEKGWVWRLAFDREPLNERAWTVQERLLARRVLHFGRKMVFWECAEANCCELHLRGVYGLLQVPTRPGSPLSSASPLSPPSTTREDEETPSQISKNFRHPWKQLLNAPDRRVCDDDLTQLFTDWYAILMQYTRCKLTVPGDKLVALSGIAKDAKTRLTERGASSADYLAGIWRETLPRGLIWNSLGGGTRPAVYRAPSWSWAAIDGPVNMQDWIHKSDDFLLVSVVGAEIVPLVGGDDTGEISGGRVILSGTLAVAKLYPAGTLWLFEKESQLIKRLETEDGQLLMEPPQVRDLQYNSSWTVLFDTASDAREEVFCLPIRIYSFANLGWQISGIALAQVEGGRYTRIGWLGIRVGTEEKARRLFSRIAVRDIEII